MRIENKALLKEFRACRRCEWCGRAGDVDPHHVFAKGHGGGLRLDVRVNLVALCRACHGLVHDGEISRFDLLTVVAARENVLQDLIVEVIHLLQRTPKETPVPVCSCGRVLCQDGRQWVVL